MFADCFLNETHPTEMHPDVHPRSLHDSLPLSLFYLRTETGDPNEYVHIWFYENAADREKKRAAMQADPGWQDYQKRSAELGALVSQTNKLMTPVDFYDPQIGRAHV